MGGLINVKKILLTIFVVILFVSAGFVLAQANQANECCKIRAGFTIKAADGFDLPGSQLEKELKNGDWVGGLTVGSVSPHCDTDGDGVSNVPTYAVQTKDWGMICFLGIIYLITKWIFIIVMLIVTVMIIYGGFLVVTAAGDPEKTTKGRKVVLYAIIGFAVALLARVIPSVVRFVIGV